MGCAPLRPALLPTGSATMRKTPLGVKGPRRPMSTLSEGSAGLAPSHSERTLLASAFKGTSRPFSPLPRTKILPLRSESSKSFSLKAQSSEALSPVLLT